MENKILEILERNNGFELNKEDIKKYVYNEKCDLKDDLGIDSFMIVQVIIDLEEEFEIEFEMEKLDIGRLRTYKGLIEVVKEKVAIS